MKQALIDLVSQKKGLVFLATVAVIIGNPIAAKLGYELEEKTMLELLTAASAYLVGQGIADHGKERAKIEAAAKDGAA